MEAKISDDETTLIQVARIINKRYRAEDMNLRDVSRLLSKCQKKMAGQAWYFPMLRKIGGWEMVTPASDVVRSLRASLFSDDAPTDEQLEQPQAHASVTAAEKPVFAEAEAAALERETAAGLRKRIQQQERVFALPSATTVAAGATQVEEDEEVDVYRFDWSKTFKLFIMHSTGLYGAYLITTGTVDYRTLILAFYMYFMAGLGITGGYHRLWAHKSYSASRPIEYLLMFYGAAAGEGSIFWWSRDHRMHHKFEDTRKDPYSIRYGFFWAHIGWLMHYKSDHMMKEGKVCRRACSACLLECMLILSYVQPVPC